MSPHLRRLGFILAGVVVVLDQLSKWWMRDIVHLPEIGRIPGAVVFPSDHGTGTTA